MSSDPNTVESNDPEQPSSDRPASEKPDAKPTESAELNPPPAAAQPRALLPSLPRLLNRLLVDRRQKRHRLPTQHQLKKPVSIGSQRDTADKSLKPSQPKAVQAALENPVDLSGKEKQPEEPLPEIKSLAGFSDDIDAEIEAALGGLSMDEIVTKSETVEVELEPNTRVKGVVTKIHNDNVFFKLNGQFEGVATLHHFKNPPAEGDLVEVIVRGVNKEDGLYELAVPGAAVGVADWDDITEGGVVDARVTGSNTGGLEVMVNSIRGFIPASQISRYRVDDFSEYVNQKFPCVVVEVNPDKRKLVLSRRAILERENEEARKELLKELEAGQVRDGTVTKLMDFGAFVDLGGVEGLVHISKLSWSRVKHPSEVVKDGEKVSVKVDKIDLDANRISLSLRDTQEHPWNTVKDQFSANDIVKGTVTRIADFGAFVKIAPGVEGLVHISELAYQRVARVSSVVNEGQEIEVKILSIDPESQKISLSHKSCLAPPAPKETTAKKGEEARRTRPRIGCAKPDRTTQGWSRS